MLAALVVVPKCLWCAFAYVGAVIGSASAPELCGDVPTTAGHASAIATGIVFCAAGVVAWLRRGHRRLGVPRLLSSPTNP